jgi:hypothetical protein
MDNGKYRVTRDCCIFGGCVKCVNATPQRRTVRIVEAEGLNREQAEKVSLQWVSYRPAIQMMSFE